MSSHTPRPVWAQNLRQRRRELGWDVRRLAEQMARSAGPNGTATVESLARRVREWEAGRSAVQERYRLLVERVLGADVFGSGSVGADGADRVRTVTAHVLGLDELTGGDDLLPLAVQSARSARAAFQSHEQPEMASAASEALQVAGWLAFDANSHVLARRLSSAAVGIAHAGGDEPKELFALAQLAMQDAHDWKPNRARQISEHALERHVTPRTRGLFELRLARAQGQEGTPVRALRTLTKARSRLGGESAAGEPSWAWWITDAELDWHEAMVHADNGNWHQSVDLFASAMEGRPVGYQRGTFSDAAHLVYALARVGAWGEAHQVLAERIMPVQGRIRCGRARACLSRVRHRAEVHNGPIELDEVLACAESANSSGTLQGQ